LVHFFTHWVTLFKIIYFVKSMTFPIKVRWTKQILCYFPHFGKNHNASTGDFHLKCKKHVINPPTLLCNSGGRFLDFWDFQFLTNELGLPTNSKSNVEQAFFFFSYLPVRKWVFWAQKGENSYKRVTQIFFLQRGQYGCKKH
jgi:hypothetical protein